MDQSIKFLEDNLHKTITGKELNENCKGIKFKKIIKDNFNSSNGFFQWGWNSRKNNLKIYFYKNFLN